jgi:hypothetical protein
MVHKVKKNKTKTIQRNWQHGTQDEEKQNKNNPEKLIVFVLFFFTLCTLCCQFLWIVFVLFFFVLCTMLPISLDYPFFFIVPSVLSNVYVLTKEN